jgi:hypothetical protein
LQQPEKEKTQGLNDRTPRNFMTHTLPWRIAMLGLALAVCRLQSIMGAGRIPSAVAGAGGVGSSKALDPKLDPGLRSRRSRAPRNIARLISVCRVLRCVSPAASDQDRGDRFLIDFGVDKLPANSPSEPA